MTDQSRGTWQLEGNVLISAVQEVKFISSSDPTLSKAEGQALEDTQLRKKSVYKSRILQIGKNASRSMPVESIYKEAVVETSCKRV